MSATPTEARRWMLLYHDVKVGEDRNGEAVYARDLEADAAELRAKVATLEAALAQREAEAEGLLSKSDEDAIHRMHRERLAAALVEERKRALEMESVLRWLDRRGGLGLDAHDAIARSLASSTTKGGESDER